MRLISHDTGSTVPRIHRSWDRAGGGLIVTGITFLHTSGRYGFFSERQAIPVDHDN